MKSKTETIKTIALILEHAFHRAHYGKGIFSGVDLAGQILTLIEGNSFNVKITEEDGVLTYEKQTPT